jgi:GDP-4-dehydro-6-deoxy-D-mannose reductase
LWRATGAPFTFSAAACIYALGGMGMRVLITGVTGMAGSHLAEILCTQGHEVWGGARWRSDLSNLRAVFRCLHLCHYDLRDAASVRALVTASHPEAVFHLAAQSYVPASWTAPAETMETNVVGEVHLMEAIRELAPLATVQIAGSSEAYGRVEPEELPITERQPFRPLSPYGVSKVAQELLGLQYHHAYGLRVIVTRAFNHEGPRRSALFAPSAFARQVAEMEAGLRPAVLHVGNLDAVRDWTDVRDVVRGYALAVIHGRPGEVYNIASGVGRRISELVDILRLEALVPFTVEVDPQRLRPADVPRLVGDASAFRAATGWAPQIDFHQTVVDLLDWWRERVHSPAEPGGIGA